MNLQVYTQTHKPDQTKININEFDMNNGAAQLLYGPVFVTVFLTGQPGSAAGGDQGAAGAGEPHAAACGQTHFLVDFSINIQYVLCFLMTVCRVISEYVVVQF